MANLEEITLYKARMMEAFCTSEQLVKLLQLDGEPEIQGKDLMYTRVFPYAHEPDTAEVAKTYICFEVNVPSVDKNNVIKTVQINIYVFTHQSLMRLPNSEGMRTDVMASEIDKIMNGSTDYGFGTVELRSAHGFNVITKYYGRELRYTVQDINRSLCLRGGNVGT